MWDVSRTIVQVVVITLHRTEPPFFAELDNLFIASESLVNL